jgi:hypothetical protein
MLLDQRIELAEQIVGSGLLVRVQGGVERFAAHRAEGAVIHR